MSSKFHYKVLSRPILEHAKNWCLEFQMAESAQPFEAPVYFLHRGLIPMHWLRGENMVAGICALCLLYSLLI